MAATGWEFRNRLLAILSAANHAGQPYVDIDCSKVHGDLGADLDPKPMSGYRDIMTKLMRPGDSILEDKMDGERAILMVRYLLKPKHN